MPQDVTFETCIDNENHKGNETIEDKEEAPVSIEDIRRQEIRVVEECPSLKSETTEETGDCDIQEDENDDDGHENVDLDDDHDKEEAKEESEVIRKNSPELDTTAAITNILSEIVGETDSRAVVGR